MFAALVSSLYSPVARSTVRPLADAIEGHPSALLAAVSPGVARTVSIQAAVLIQRVRNATAEFILTRAIANRQAVTVAAVAGFLLGSDAPLSLTVSLLPGDIALGDLTDQADDLLRSSEIEAYRVQQAASRSSPAIFLEQTMCEQLFEEEIIPTFNRHRSATNVGPLITQPLVAEVRTRLAALINFVLSELLEGAVDCSSDDRPQSLVCRHHLTANLVQRDTGLAEFLNSSPILRKSIDLQSADVCSIVTSANTHFDLRNATALAGEVTRLVLPHDLRSFATPCECVFIPADHLAALRRRTHLVGPLVDEPCGPCDLDVGNDTHHLQGRPHSFVDDLQHAMATAHCTCERKRTHIQRAAKQLASDGIFTRQRVAELLEECASSPLCVGSDAAVSDHLKAHRQPVEAGTPHQSPELPRETHVPELSSIELQAFSRDFPVRILADHEFACFSIVVFDSTGRPFPFHFDGRLVMGYGYFINTSEPADDPTPTTVHVSSVSSAHSHADPPCSLANPYCTYHPWSLTSNVDRQTINPEGLMFRLSQSALAASSSAFTLQDQLSSVSTGLRVASELLSLIRIAWHFYRQHHERVQLQQYDVLERFAAEIIDPAIKSMMDISIHDSQSPVITATPAEPGIAFLPSSSSIATYGSVARVWPFALSQLISQFVPLSAFVAKNGVDSNQGRAETKVDTLSQMQLPLFVPAGFEASDESFLPPPLLTALKRQFAPITTAREALDRLAWYHQPVKVAHYARLYARNELSPYEMAGGHPLLTQRYHVRPLQYYGRAVLSILTGQAADPSLSTRLSQVKYDADEMIDCDRFSAMFWQYFSFELLDNRSSRSYPCLMEYKFGNGDAACRQQHTIVSHGHTIARSSPSRESSAVSAMRVDLDAFRRAFPEASTPWEVLHNSGLNSATAASSVAFSGSHHVRRAEHVDPIARWEMLTSLSSWEQRFSSLEVLSSNCAKQPPLAPPHLRRLAQLDKHLVDLMFSNDSPFDPLTFNAEQVRAKRVSEVQERLANASSVEVKCGCEANSLPGTHNSRSTCTHSGSVLVDLREDFRSVSSKLTDEESWQLELEESFSMAARLANMRRWTTTLFTQNHPMEARVHFTEMLLCHVIGIRSPSCNSSPQPLAEVDRTTVTTVSLSASKMVAAESRSPLSVALSIIPPSSTFPARLRLPHSVCRLIAEHVPLVELPFLVTEDDALPCAGDLLSMCVTTSRMGARAHARAVREKKAPQDCLSKWPVVVVSGLRSSQINAILFIARSSAWFLASPQGGHLPLTSHSRSPSLVHTCHLIPSESCTHRFPQWRFHLVQLAVAAWRTSPSLHRLVMRS